MALWLQLWTQLWVDVWQNNIRTPQSSNFSSTIPNQPMMSYDVRWTILPWVEDDKAKQIIDLVDSKTTNETEKKVLLQEYHQQAVKFQQQKAYEAERAKMKQDINIKSLNAKSQDEKLKLQATLKIANFADILRDKAKNDGIELPNLLDDDLISKYMQSNQDKMPIYKDYVEWKTQWTDVLKSLGMIKEEKMDLWEKNPLLRAWWAAIGSIVGAVKWLYEWVVPWFKEMIDDSKEILARKDKTSWEKFAQIVMGEWIADYLGWIVGKTVWWALEWWLKWFTTEQERKILWDKAANAIQSMAEVAKTNPDIQVISNMYNNLDDNTKQDVNDYLWYAGNLFNLAMLWEWTAIKWGIERWLVQWEKILQRTVWWLTDDVSTVASKIWAKFAKNTLTEAEKSTIKWATNADKILDNLHWFTKAEIRKYKAKFWETPWQTLNNKGLIEWWEETLDRTLEDMITLQKEKKAALSEIKQTIPKDDDVIKMAREVADYENKTLTPSQIKAGEWKKWEDLVMKAENGELTHIELEEIKKTFESKQSLKYDATRTSAEQERLKNLDSSIRTKQQQWAEEAGFDNIKDINKDISKNKSISDLLAKDIDWIGWLWLTDYILLAESASNPATIALLATKKIAQSSWFKKNLIKLSNMVNGKATTAEKVADMIKIRNISNKTELENLLKPALPEPRAIEIPEWWLPQTSAISPLSKERQIIESNRPLNSNIKDATDMNIMPDNSNLWGKKVNTINESIPQDKVMLKAPEEPLIAYNWNPYWKWPSIAKDGELWEWMYFTRSKDLAKNYSNPRWDIKNMLESSKQVSINKIDLSKYNIKQITKKEYLSDRSKLYKIEQEINNWSWNEWIAKKAEKKLIDKYKSEWYDWLEIKDENQWVIFKDSIESNKTKWLPVKESIPQDKVTVKAPEEPLIAEASKYKSAEEFIESKWKPLYHWTDAKFDEFSLSRAWSTDEWFLWAGIYLTPRKWIAKQYWKNMVKTYPNIKNPLVIDDVYMFWGVNPDVIRQKLGLNLSASARDVRWELIKQWYDWVYVNELLWWDKKKLIEVVALKPNQIKTEAQLKQIREEANKTK